MIAPLHHGILAIQPKGVEMDSSPAADDKLAALVGVPSVCESATRGRYQPFARAP